MTGTDPKFVDIDLENYTLDYDELRRAVAAEDVDAVLPVHLYGHPVDIDSLRDICGSIPIVSDACEAHGAEIDGEKVGSKAMLSAFSFYPTKNLAVAGDGGMVTTDDEKYADHVRKSRDIGREDPGSYDHDIVGYTARLNTINAAIGETQLRNIEDWNERRRPIAAVGSASRFRILLLVSPPDADLRTGFRRLSTVLFIDDGDVVLADSVFFDVVFVCSKSELDAIEQCFPSVFG